MAVIGIDLGTSTSEIAVYKDGKVIVIPNDKGNRITPSYVGISTDGEMIFGEDAKSQYLGRPQDTVREFKRLMGTDESVKLGGREYRPEEVSALLLGYLKGCAEEYLKETIEEAVITVPANFDDNQRQATMLAAKIAGLKCERIINEPTAAAMAFGIKNMDKDMRVLVYDFGGGTLDVTVLKMFEGILDVETSYGDTKLGGKDFDEKMMNIITRKVYEKNGVNLDRNNLIVLSKLKEAAERAKIDLSFVNETTVTLENIVLNGKLVNTQINITRREFEDEVMDLVEKSGVVIDKALKDKGLTYEDIDFVLMVGGTTRIPVVRNYVKNKLNKNIRTEINPDEAVCMGAAIQAAIKAGVISEENSLVITDVCPFNLGTSCVTEVNGMEVAGILSTIIERNSTVPITRSQIYTTAIDYQTEMNIDIYQTLDNNCIWAKDATLIGQFMLDNIPARPKGEEAIKIEYSYDINGNIKAVAEVLSTGHRRQIEIKRAINMQDVVQNEVAAVLDNYKECNLYKKYKMTIEGAEKRLNTLGESEIKKELMRLLNELKQYIIQDDEDMANEIEGEIIDLLFDID
ncbi:Hsp70 family protein [Caloramator proteoclasticus]|uniref:Chaperone protein DnaK n=1 Tax=Caloramator proteoclasticus DSM 10124 TaxID=1121262 RepID=A0A1M4Z1Y4_9CLOT|nr:Hsp70 family protein [Caloramator proteoclasticus]SHF12093.1 molecular chaperone DnaK [Caloramator proteoclasticus DSM 10124]